MKLFDVTTWSKTQKKTFEKAVGGCFAEGETYKNSYIVTFASNEEMYKHLYKHISDKYGKVLNIQYFKEEKKK